MPKVTADMTITLDGYASGRNQSREHPFGDIDAERLHAWMFDHVRRKRRGERRDHRRRRLRDGPQHVRSRPGRVGPRLDGLVGTQPSLPRAGLHPLPPPAPERRDGGRHRSSTSSPTGSRRRWSGPARPRARRTSRSPAAPASSTSTSPPARSTSCDCTWRRSSPGAASAFRGHRRHRADAGVQPHHAPRHPPRLPPLTKRLAGSGSAGISAKVP